MENTDWVLLFFGLALAVWAPLEMWKDARRQALRTRRTRGRVVGSQLQYRHELDGGFTPGTHHAVVEFEVGGRSYSCVADHGVSWKKPRNGEAVTVAYDPRDPLNAEVYVEALRTLEQVLRFALPVVGVFLLLLLATRQLMG